MENWCRNLTRFLPAPPTISSNFLFINCISRGYKIGDFSDLTYFIVFCEITFVCFVVAILYLVKGDCNPDD